MTPAPTQSQIQTALRSFLIAVLPIGTPVVVGQVNRVAEPQAGAFVVMTPIRVERLRTNLDGYADAKFTGSITGNTLDITHVYPNSGKIGVGSTIFGVGVAANTQVTALGTGTGGLGTYVLGGAPQTVSGETISAGSETVEQGAKWTVQLDFHSADLSAAGDMAQTVSTLFRDDFAVEQFANQSPNYGVAPLLADDPRQVPFINDQGQYEWRWIVEAMLQSNQVVIIPQQFSDSAVVGLINVDERYPAS